LQAEAYFRKAAAGGVAEASMQLAAALSTGFTRDVVDAGRLQPAALTPVGDLTASLPVLGDAGAS
jgi:TPR repeat protein